MRSWTCLRIGGNVDAENTQITGIGGHQSGGQTHERGLAGAVGPDQRGERAAPDLERDAVERVDDIAGSAAKRFPDVACRHGGARGHPAAHAFRLASVAPANRRAPRSVGQADHGRRAFPGGVCSLRILHEDPDLVDQARAQLRGLHRLRRELGDRRDEADPAVEAASPGRLSTDRDRCRVRYGLRSGSAT